VILVPTQTSERYLRPTTRSVSGDQRVVGDLQSSLGSRPVPWPGLWSCVRAMSARPSAVAARPRCGCARLCWGAG